MYVRLILIQINTFCNAPSRFHRKWGKYKFWTISGHCFFCCSCCCWILVLVSCQAFISSLVMKLDFMSQPSSNSTLPFAGLQHMQQCQVIFSHNFSFYARCLAYFRPLFKYFKSEEFAKLFSILIIAVHHFSFKSQGYLSVRGHIMTELCW